MLCARQNTRFFFSTIVHILRNPISCRVRCVYFRHRDRDEKNLRISRNLQRGFYRICNTNLHCGKSGLVIFRAYFFSLGLLPCRFPNTRNDTCSNSSLDPCATGKSLVFFLNSITDVTIPYLNKCICSANKCCQTLVNTRL